LDLDDCGNGRDSERNGTLIAEEKGTALPNAALVTLGKATLFRKYVTLSTGSVHHPFSVASLPCLVIGP
jgi:hypothetical protein